MSLVGFRAQNHPQQPPKDEVDDRAITLEDFAPLHERYRFTIDAAASPSNARLPRYWTIADDALAQTWEGERVWCNPPYSNLREWVAKASRSRAELVVMLLPANRTEQGWWQHYIERDRDCGDGLSVVFLPGRMRFLRNGAQAVGPNERPPFGCCLAIFEERYTKRKWD